MSKRDTDVIVEAIQRAHLTQLGEQQLIGALVRALGAEAYRVVYKSLVWMEGSPRYMESDLEFMASDPRFTGIAPALAVATLSPRPQDGDVNRRLAAAGPLYGVEVTVPALADLCEVNLDPQHLGGDASTAAVEAALAAPLPADGATLVTVREDVDSLGAMAVLRLRRAGVPLGGGPRTRIAAIAAADKEAAGSWPGPRPLVPDRVAVSPVAALASVIMDRHRALSERVEVMENWILWGVLEDQEAIELRLVDESQRAADAFETSVRTTTSGAQVAVVVGAHRLGLSTGYRLAPVVVFTNPEFVFTGAAGAAPHRKHNVARWNSAYPMDWDGMLAELQAMEPGWGGSTSICGSPQGVASSLTTEDVVNIVVRHV